MDDDSTYAPRSPNLSAQYRPRSPDLSTYAPRSPDLSAYYAGEPDAQPPPQPALYQQQSGQAYLGVPHPIPAPRQPSSAFSAAPNAASQSRPPAASDSPPPARSRQRTQVKYDEATSESNSTAPQSPSTAPKSATKARARKRAPGAEGGDDSYGAPPLTGKGSGRGRKAKKAKVEEQDYGTDKRAPGEEEGVDVRTKFPVARIKRIMQADEDVGKVAQVTPTAVCECCCYLPLLLYPPPPFTPSSEPSLLWLYIDTVLTASVAADSESAGTLHHLPRPQGHLQSARQEL